MPELLPASPSEAAYWAELHGRPLAAWQPALEAIRERHGLPTGGWARFPLGRNLVFALESDAVVKLVPPFWREGEAREAAALAHVHGRLPVPTPELVGRGELEGWPYLVETRLPGEPLRARWGKLEPEERARLARRHGEIMAALHALPVADAPPVLGFDWAGMLEEQRSACRAEMEAGGVPDHLLRGLPDLFERAWPALEGGEPAVLLHGDLNFLNLLVEPGSPGLEIVALVDLSDAKLGPAGHELISPGVHQYQGGAELTALHEGYGLEGGRSGSSSRPARRSTTPTGGVGCSSSCRRRRVGRGRRWPGASGGFLENHPDQFFLERNERNS